MKKKNIAIILSGGTGKRFGGTLPKQFYKLGDKNILEINVEKFLNSNLFFKVIIVSHRNNIKKTQNIFRTKKNIIIVKGGESRQKSVFNGLKECKKLTPERVVIHDSARPLFSPKLLFKMFKFVKSKQAVVPIIKISDSIRNIEGLSYTDIDRSNLYRIQTPQLFDFSSIYNAHKNIKKKKYTDDSIIGYKYGIKISTIEGEKFNFKITTKEDYKIAKIMNVSFKRSLNRVGQGFDVHKFKPGKKLIILGTKIPFNKSLEGHSDADVGFHAIVDAILGAMGKGDIGEHFPPSEKKWKNKPSIFFMKYAKDLLTAEGFTIDNIDLTVICEKPKLIDYKMKMTKNTASALKISSEKVNIKATTTEGLGFLGREEGIASQAIVSISKTDDH